MLCNKNENTNIPSFGKIGIGVEIILKNESSFCYLQILILLANIRHLWGGRSFGMRKFFV